MMTETPFWQTIGGNIVTGSPISDIMPLLMAAGSTLLLQSHGNGMNKVN